MLNDLLKQKNVELILASKSPRRQDLLKKLALDFKILVSDVDETYPDNISTFSIPEYLACKKAKSIQVVNENQLIISADTIVILGNDIIGKPKDLDDAKLILKKLSGKMHYVITGVCLRANKQETSFSSETKVWFRDLSDEEINFYVETYKPLDKAGAYGIQEWIGYIGIEKIEGSFYNVVGLPVEKLYVELVKFLKSKF